MWMEILFSMIFFVLPLIGMFVMILIGGFRREKAKGRIAAIRRYLFDEDHVFNIKRNYLERKKWKLDTS